jgi:hypothetical protein
LRVGKPQVRAVSHPGDIPVGPNQHGSRSSDPAEYRKLPLTNVFSVDQPAPIRLWSDGVNADRPRATRGAHHILAVDAAAMHAAGHAFYQAANGVRLTDHVPPG